MLNITLNVFKTYGKCLTPSCNSVLTGFLPHRVVFSPAAFFEGGLLQNDASYNSNLILDLVT